MKMVIQNNSNGLKSQILNWSLAEAKSHEMNHKSPDALSYHGVFVHWTEASVKMKINDLSSDFFKLHLCELIFARRINHLMPHLLFLFSP